MDNKTKVDFNHITNLNYSNRNQCHHNIEDNYINDNILLFCDEDIEMDKKEIKKNNKTEFEHIFREAKKKLVHLSNKTNDIINSKSFSFKNLLLNHINIQQIPKSENINNNNISDIENNILIENTEDNHSPSDIFLGKKRKDPNLSDYENIEMENKETFNEILIICREISILNNIIVKKEEQNSITSDNENIETTLIINDKPIVTVYTNKDVINKLYIFKFNKSFEKQNEVLTQLKQIKKNMSNILIKLKKN